MITKDVLMGTMGQFTWMFGTEWFIETEIGNFVWMDPDYGDGDNTITLYKGSYDDFRKSLNLQMGRDKGFNLIGNKCGADFTFNRIGRR